MLSSPISSCATQRDAVNTHLAEGAIVIDTTGLTLDDVVARIAAIVEERRA